MTHDALDGTLYSRSENCASFVGFIAADISVNVVPHHGISCMSVYEDCLARMCTVPVIVNVNPSEGLC